MPTELLHDRIILVNCTYHFRNRRFLLQGVYLGRNVHLGFQAGVHAASCKTGEEEKKKNVFVCCCQVELCRDLAMSV